MTRQDRYNAMDSQTEREIRNEIKYLESKDGLNERDAQRLKYLNRLILEDD